MKYVPINRTFDLFDDMFDGFMNQQEYSIMKTDVHEKDGYYLLEMELPGYTKENVNIDLVDGYLKISATRTASKEENDQKGKIVRQERSYGSCSRSFYVGENIKSEDVKAKFENGILNIVLPSKEQKSIETKQTVYID